LWSKRLRLILSAPTNTTQMLQRIRYSKPVQQLRSFLQQKQIKNTSTTLYEVVKILWHKIINLHIDVRAAAVAFNFTLAVFPALIFVFSIIPYIPIRHLDHQIMGFMATVLPEALFHEARTSIQEIIGKRQGDVLSFGFFLALFASTSGMIALMRAFNLAYRTNETRGLIKSRLIAVGLNFLLSFMLLVAIVILIVGRLVVDYLFDRDILSPNLSFYALKITTYAAVFSVFFLSVSTIYYIAPNIKKRWSFFNVGSVTASVLIILATNGFSYYLSRFATYNKLYGSIGTIIALMVWLYLIALILLVGFEINATIDQAKNAPLTPETENAFFKSPLM
jgi:membrane protein